MSEKVQENINSHEQIKNKISDYIIENFKTRNSNEKKQEIVNMVDQLSFQERNQILDYISDQARSISEYQNCDDQSQLLYLLKDLKAEEGFLRTIKMDLCELGATVMNQTGPLAKRNREPLGADVYGGLNGLGEQKEIVQNSEYFLQGGAMQDRNKLFTLNKNLTKVQDLGNNSFRVKYYFEYLGAPREGVVLVSLQPNGRHTVTNEFGENMQVKYGHRRNISLGGRKNEYPQETRIQQYNEADKEYLSTQVRFFTARQEEVTLDFAKKKENIQNVIHNY